MIAITVAACTPAAPTDRLVVSPGHIDEELKADAVDGPRAELKVMVDEDAIDDVRDELGLESDLAEQRAIWFYDTATLDLLAAGAILRARSVHDDDDDSTVKIRPLAAEEVDPAWFEIDGFKCELDANPVSAASSCSLSGDVDEDQIEEVADGERELADLFSPEQSDFLAAHGPWFYWDELEPFGPIDALVWKLESEQLPSDLTAEHWDLPGSEMLELSIKVPVDEADERMSELLGWLDDHEVPLSDEQESKTRRALEALLADAAADDAGY